MSVGGLFLLVAFVLWFLQGLGVKAIPGADSGAVQGPNGEKLQFQIGNKSLGLSTNNLLSIIMLGAMSLGLYLFATSMTARLDRGNLNQETGFRKLETLLEVMHQHQKEMLAAIRHNLDMSGTLMHDHNRLLVEKWDEIIRHQMTNAHEERRQHALILHNMSRDPSEHLPLELTPPERR